jgi:hypothetical protein
VRQVPFASQVKTDCRSPSPAGWPGRRCTPSIEGRARVPVRLPAGSYGGLPLVLYRSAQGAAGADGLVMLAP